MRVLFGVVVVALVAALGVPAHAYDFSDARHIVSISDPQISPDGARVVFVRGRADFANDRIDRQLVLVDVRTHAERQLTYDRKGVFGPQWSPDGETIYFAALDGDAKNPQEQVFAMPMSGGDARQVTHAKNGVISWYVSPNGRRIAYTMQDDNPDQKRIDAHLDAFQVHDNDYLHRAATPPVHVWLVHADGSATKQLTHGAWSAADVNPDGGGELAWSSDGTRLVLEHFRTPFVGNALEAYFEVLDPATGALHRLTPGEAMQSAPAYAPHGDDLAYLRNTGGDYTLGTDVYVVNGAGKHVYDLRTQLDRSIDAFSWNASGDALWLLGGNGVDRALWYAPLRGRVHRVALDGLEGIGLGNAARNGAFVFTASRPQAAGELYYLASPAAKPVALTHLNAFAARSGLAKRIGIAWNATKGRFVEDGILTYPLHYRGGKAPLVLLIHGGPQAASSLAFSSQAQIFAAHGFFVFEPNYRGSTNLGDAYQHAITNDAGDGPGKDVMAGLARVESLVPIDTSRVGVSGWSYGGYMTSWLIGHYPKVWKAAVSGASLDDWLDDYDIAFYYDLDVPFFRGKPWNPANTAEWREQSPIAAAPNAKAPTLIMGDIGDNNVTITNSFKLYHALKDNGTTVRFVAYPVAGHFPSDPVRSEDVEKRWLAWLESYLK
ncbi:MAG: S9 family peptidase [bacterium]|nr:S9 family peptidase [bacterium]